MLRTALIFFFILSCFVTAASAKEVEVSYNIQDGMLHIAGYVLAPAEPIECDEEEAPCFVKYDVSPDGRWAAIYFGDGYDNDRFWLYDVQSRSRPMPLDVAGRHMFIHWHGDDILEIMAAGMGYTISYIYDPASPQERAIVNDMLLLDPERKLYVRFIQDEGYMVAIGRIFSKNAEEERFPFSLESKWVTDALGKVEEVKLSGEKLFVTHRKEDGTLVKEDFSPELLRE